MVVVDKYRGIFDGTCEELKVMDNEIIWCEDRLDQVIMPELNGVGEEEHFGGAINISSPFHHFRCFHVVDGSTKMLLFSDTVKLRHYYLIQPILTP